MVEYSFDDAITNLIDIVLTSIFIIEFVYNFWIAPKPKSLFFKKLDTWIDAVTIITPMIEIYSYFTQNTNYETEDG